MLGSSHRAPFSVLPIFFPSLVVRREVVRQYAGFCSFLRISSTPPSMLLHWSSPPICSTQPYLRLSSRKS